MIFKDKYNQKLTVGEAMPKIANRISNYWLDFELLVLKICGYVPSHTFRRVVYKLAGIKLGKGSTFHIGAGFFDPRNIEIGEDSIIGDHAFLDGRDKLKIGDHVDIASQVMIYNSQHNLNSERFEATTAPVEIENYVFIGPRSIILPGVRIGKGSVVAAGAVVTKDVEDFSIVAGVPAKAIGERKNKNPNYILGRPRLFQ